MSAGTGVTHSEFNPSLEEKVHLLQVWILPERRGLTPEYEQRSFPDEERRGRLRLVASPHGRDGSLTIHQDASVYVATLEVGGRVSHALGKGRRAWVQVTRGRVRLGEEVVLGAGDGAGIVDLSSFDLTGSEPSDLLLFDLA